jgi:hypothetical protein
LAPESVDCANLSTSDEGVRISGDLRDRAGQSFRLAQILEDIVDLLVHMHVMRMFDYAVKLMNHPESDLDSQKSATTFLTK